MQIVRYNVRKKSAALNYSLFDAKGWIHLHYTPLSAKEKNQTDKHITAAVKIPKLMGVINCLYHVPQLHIRRSLEWDQTTSRNSWQPMRMLKIVSQPLHYFQPCYLWQTFIWHFGLSSPITGLWTCHFLFVHSIQGILLHNKESKLCFATQLLKQWRVQGRGPYFG